MKVFTYRPSETTGCFSIEKNGQFIAFVMSEVIAKEIVDACNKNSTTKEEKNNGIK